MNCFQDLFDRQKRQFATGVTPAAGGGLNSSTA